MGTSASKQPVGTVPSGPPAEGPRKYPDDFPNPTTVKSAEEVAALIRGASASLTSIRIDGGTFTFTYWWWWWWWWFTLLLMLIRVRLEQVPIP